MGYFDVVAVRVFGGSFYELGEVRADPVCREGTFCRRERVVLDVFGRGSGEGSDLWWVYSFCS